MYNIMYGIQTHPWNKLLSYTLSFMTEVSLEAHLNRLVAPSATLQLQSN